MFTLNLSSDPYVVFVLSGLEHQHTHNAPHALTPGIHTDEALAAINAPDIIDAADANHNPVVGATIPAAVKESEEHGGEERLQTLMGMSLLLGFIFMLFVDQLGGGHSHSPSSGSSTHLVATQYSNVHGDFPHLRYIHSSFCPKVNALGEVCYFCVFILLSGSLNYHVQVYILR